MTVKPVLGDWEIPRISHIKTLEQREFVELSAPGRVGSLFQDMNTVPTRIAIWGSLFGEEDRNEFLETLREKFREGEPVTFVADIVTATEVQYVIIDMLQIVESGQRPDQIDYFLVIRESPPPPPPADPLGALDSGLLDQAGDFLDTISAATDLIDGLGSVPDISNPTPPLTAALNDLTAATDGLDESLSGLTEIFGS